MPAFDASTVARSQIKLPVLFYGGTTDSNDYQPQFELITLYHGWHDEDIKYYILCERLKGEAVSVLLETAHTSSALVRALRQNFSPALRWLHEMSCVCASRSLVRVLRSWLETLKRKCTKSDQRWAGTCRKH